MEQNTQPQPKTINIPVYRDGELDTDYMPVPPTVLEQARDTVKAYIGEVGIDLKARALDRVYGTNYAKIRRDLLKERKKERFASSIGLVLVKN